VQDLLVDRLDDARPVVVPERHHPAGPLDHAQRPRVGVEGDGARRGVRADLEPCAPLRHVQEQIVARLGHRAGAPGPDPEGAGVRPELVDARRKPHAGSIRNASDCRVPPQGRPTPHRGAPRMAVVLDHTFTTAKPLEESWATVLDLERTVPCVEGATVLETTGPDGVRAEIKVRMGAMSMNFTGTVDIVEKDPAAHRMVMRVKSKEAGGQGFANADVEITCNDGGGTIHTNAQITG